MPDTLPLAKYWTASPTYHSWVKLTAAQIIRTLTTRPGFEGQNVLFHGTHPIRYAYLLGTIQSIDVVNARTSIIVLDDGSGLACLEVLVRQQQQVDAAQPAGDGNGPTLVTGLTRAYSTADNAPGLFLAASTREGPPTQLCPGMRIKAKGTFCAFAGMRQVELRRVAVLKDTRDEVRWWRDCCAFHASVLSVPWTLGEAERERLDAQIAKGVLREARGALERERRRVRREKGEARREERRGREEREMDEGALV